jgi:hypothetical protein
LTGGLLAAHEPGIPFELVSSKPYLQVRVNGSEPLWFILDTGTSGSCLLDRKRALELGITIENEKKGHFGAGEGAVLTMGYARGLSLGVGERTVANQTAAVLPLEHVSVYDGHQFDGTLGGAFMARYVVEVDYPNNLIHLHEARTYRYAGKGKTIPMEFLGGHITVRASFTVPGGKPIEGVFIVDTGTRMALIFNRPFVEKHRLLDAVPAKFRATVGGGAGGEGKGYVTRLASMQIGTFALKEPVAVFSSDKSGVLASDSFAGIIGGVVLRRCKVIFDYGRKQLILEPASSTPEPYEYDMSGLFLTGEGPEFNRFRVMSVAQDSPAEEAGMKRDDVITEINGKPSAEFTLEGLRDLLLQEGRQINLEIKRGEEKLKVSFKTRRLI